MSLKRNDFSPFLGAFSELFGKRRHRGRGLLSAAFLAVCWGGVSPQGAVAGDMNGTFCPRAPRVADVIGSTHNQSGFSFEKMFVSARLSQHAYREGNIANKVRQAGLRRVKVIQSSETSFSGYLARHEDRVYLGVSGTHDAQDAMLNSKIDLVAESTGLVPGKVHTGFQEGLDSVWHRIVTLLRTDDFVGLPLHITGHSLGAATATLAAARLHALGFDVDEVYAFASPRLGDAEFAHWYNTNLGNQSIRFIRGLDIVPRIPPAYQDLPQFLQIIPRPLVEGFRRRFETNRYQHAGQLYWFEENDWASYPEWPAVGDDGYWTWLGERLNLWNPARLVWRGRHAGLHHIPEGYVCHAVRNLIPWRRGAL